MDVSCNVAYYDEILDFLCLKGENVLPTCSYLEKFESNFLMGCRLLSSIITITRGLVKTGLAKLSDEILSHVDSANRFQLSLVDFILLNYILVTISISFFFSLKKYFFEHLYF